MDKKLAFNKATVASLNPDQQLNFAGGAPRTFEPICQTRLVTCETRAYTDEFCKPCKD